MRKIIGGGSYGKVYKINDSCAVKCVEKNSISLLEPCIMSSFSHKNVLHAKKVNLIKNLNIHCDLAICDLSVSLYKNDFVKKEWISQIKEGLDFLHEKNIIHGDIKASNILVFENCVKICDFSLTILKKHVKLDYTKNVISVLDYVLCTANYRAPELWQRRDFNYTIDLWSYGCLVFEILNKKMLFSSSIYEKTCDCNSNIDVQKCRKCLNLILDEYELFFKDRNKFLLKYKFENTNLESFTKYLNKNPKDRDDKEIKNNLKLFGEDIDFESNIFTEEFSKLKKNTLLRLKKSNFKCLTN